LAARIEHAANTARARDRLRMTPAAETMWERVYPELSCDRSGLFGSVTARAEAQCIRLALVYALLDETDAMDVTHLRAALAVWDYCEATARFVFGEALGDRVADILHRWLQYAGDSGMARTGINKLFSGHVAADRIDQALALLQRRGLATAKAVNTPGAPAQMWMTTSHAKEAE
jgi:hypothetical protein